MPPETRAPTDLPPWLAADSIGFSVWRRLARFGIAPARMGSRILDRATTIHDRHMSFLDMLTVPAPGRSAADRPRQVGDARVFRHRWPGVATIAPASARMLASGATPPHLAHSGGRLPLAIRPLELTTEPARQAPDPPATSGPSVAAVAERIGPPAAVPHLLVSPVEPGSHVIGEDGALLDPLRHDAILGRSLQAVAGRSIAAGFPPLAITAVPGTGHPAMRARRPWPLRGEISSPADARLSSSTAVNGPGRSTAAVEGALSVVGGPGRTSTSPSIAARSGVPTARPMATLAKPAPLTRVKSWPDRTISTGHRINSPPSLAETDYRVGALPIISQWRADSFPYRLSTSRRVAGDGGIEYVAAADRDKATQPSAETKYSFARDRDAEATTDLVLSSPLRLSVGGGSTVGERGIREQPIPSLEYGIRRRPLSRIIPTTNIVWGQALALDATSAPFGISFSLTARKFPSPASSLLARRSRGMDRLENGAPRVVHDALVAPAKATLSDPAVALPAELSRSPLTRLSPPSELLIEPRTRAAGLAVLLPAVHAHSNMLPEAPAPAPIGSYSVPLSSRAGGGLARALAFPAPRLERLAKPAELGLPIPIAHSGSRVADLHGRATMAGIARSGRTNFELLSRTSSAGLPARSRPSLATTGSVGEPLAASAMVPRAAELAEADTDHGGTHIVTGTDFAAETASAIALLYPTLTITNSARRSFGRPAVSVLMRTDPGGSTRPRGVVARPPADFGSAAPVRSAEPFAGLKAHLATRRSFDEPLAPAKPPLQLAAMASADARNTLPPMAAMSFVAAASPSSTEMPSLAAGSDILVRQIFGRELVPVSIRLTETTSTPPSRDHPLRIQRRQPGSPVTPLVRPDAAQRPGIVEMPLAMAPRETHPAYPMAPTVMPLARAASPQELPAAALAPGHDRLPRAGQDSGSPKSAEPGATQMEPDDVAELAWRAFMTRLAVERERRGFQRWA